MAGTETHNYLDDERLVNAWNNLCEHIDMPEYVNFLVKFIKEYVRHASSHNKIYDAEAVINCIKQLNLSNSINISFEQANRIYGLISGMTGVMSNIRKQGDHRRLMNDLASNLNETKRYLYVIIGSIPRVAGELLNAAEVDVDELDDNEDIDAANNVIRYLYIKTYSVEQYLAQIPSNALNTRLNIKYPDLVAKVIQTKNFDEYHFIIWMDMMIRKMFDYWNIFFEAKLGRNNHPNISRYLSYAIELMADDNRDTPAIIRAWEFIKYIEAYQTHNSTLYNLLLGPISLIPKINNNVTRMRPPSPRLRTDDEIKTLISENVKKNMNKKQNDKLTVEYAKPGKRLQCNSEAIKSYINSGLLQRAITKGYEEASKSAWKQLWNAIWYKAKKLYRKHFRRPNEFTSQLANFGHFAVPDYASPVDNRHRRSVWSEVQGALAQMASQRVMTMHY